MQPELFPGFTTHRIQTSGAEIRCVVGGAGPPLLLLHGYPQTHAMWHQVAPSLAHRFTVVCADLRGYGDSSKPESDATHAAFATAYYHWFFLIQPFDLPERLIGADPVYYLHRKLGGWGTGMAHFDPRALAEYERCFSDPATIHATCEDYRAAASIDLAHDADDADRRVTCQLMVLWGEKGVVHRLFDPIEDWRGVANDVRGKALPCGHYLAEEVPAAVLEEFSAFFA